MERYRRKKLILIITLLLTISGLSIGFAAMSTVLTITAGAKVVPDASSFKVVLIGDVCQNGIYCVKPTVTGKATATMVAFRAGSTTISGIKVNFTEPGETATYKFYAYNDGSYVAYLRNIKFNSLSQYENIFKRCTPGANANADLVSQACESIKVNISVGDISTGDTISVSNHSLDVQQQELYTLTFSYLSDGARADGPFSIEFGDITLEYSSVDTSNISFKMHYGGYGEYTETYSIADGDTWRDFVLSHPDFSWYLGYDSITNWGNSDAERVGISTTQDNIIDGPILLNGVYVKHDDVIVANADYLMQLN